MAQTYTISIFTENSPGVLHRITVLFTRRKINIESLTVCETEEHGTSRFTIVVVAPKEIVNTIVKQVDRIVEVKKVYASENSELVYKEIAFYKVNAENASKRREIEEHAIRHRAEIIYAEEKSVVIEKTGNEDETVSLFRLFEPFGIAEFVRSGRIAIRKGREINGHQLIDSDE